MKWSVDGFPDSLNFNYTVSNVSHINYTNSDDDVLLPPHRRTFFRWIGWWWWSWVDESFFFGFPRVKIVHWKVGNLLVGNLITDRRCRGEMFERRKKKKVFYLKLKVSWDHTVAFLLLIELMHHRFVSASAATVERQKQTSTKWGKRGRKKFSSLLDYLFT